MSYAIDPKKGTLNGPDPSIFPQKLGTEFLRWSGRGSGSGCRSRRAHAGHERVVVLDVQEGSYHGDLGGCEGGDLGLDGALGQEPVDVYLLCLSPAVAWYEDTVRHQDTRDTQDTRETRYTHIGGWPGCRRSG